MHVLIGYSIVIMTTLFFAGDDFLPQQGCEMLGNIAFGCSQSFLQIQGVKIPFQQVADDEETQGMAEAFESLGHGNRIAWNFDFFDRT